jgi:phospholipid N-methyltransferase
VLFVREALSNPRDVGALFPSSRTLARKMAALVDPAEDSYVLELGAGTGVVTEALLEHGIPPQRLIVLERSTSLADLLRSRFPSTRVICGDAADLRLLLRHHQGPGPKPGSASIRIVSSLPLRVLPPDKVHAILREIAGVLRPGGSWIQYTYALGQREVPAGFVRQQTTLVWQNVPPARVDVFKTAPRN